VAVGDLNGDGKLDLAVANSSSNTVSVLLGTGNGAFQPQVSYVTGTSPRSVTVGDLNGDGKLDLAVANYNSASVSVLLGNGNGTFQFQTEQSVFGTPGSLTIGNFNRDGKPDLAATSLASNVILVLPGYGTGTFYDINYGTNLATSPIPVSMSIGDLNGDGASDIVVADFSSNTVGVLLNYCH
jgi:FG-GAP-like repeat